MLKPTPKEPVAPAGHTFVKEAEGPAPLGTQCTLVPASTAVTAHSHPPRKKSKAGDTGRAGLRPETHFSLPSPTTAILLLSSVQAMSLIFPAKG